MQSAKEWRRRADEYVKQGKFALAADAYRHEAAIYRRNGDTEGAKVEESKANRYASGVRLYAHVRGRAGNGGRGLAKWEPAYGCYLGAFLDRDERLGRGFLANDQLHRDPEAFGRLTGKKIASAFCYVAYGRAFPSGWVGRLKAQGVAPHIAWEPNQGLGAVGDDDYLRQFARDAARADCPIFLRYASEMNGDWTRYGGDPLLYKVKWAIVQGVMARYAPNVAMVWCVNNIPERPIEKFYPGDNLVDWVGVNLYSVPFYDNDPSRVGLNANPADGVRFVYNRFAASKPIMICEFGASHRAKADGIDRSAWAASKINEMYASLPRLYPRVKLIDIFDNNNLVHADDAARQLNNYSVTDSDEVLRGYTRAVSGDYFLSNIGDRATTAIVPMDGKNLRVGRGILRVSSWARCWSQRFGVTYAVDGREVTAVAPAGGREADISLPTPGLHRVAAIVRDDRGQVTARTEATVTVV